jgi:hypothetical protein
MIDVDDGAVGDAGVDEGHAHRFVAEHGGDCFDAHAVVDGLGCQFLACVRGDGVVKGSSGWRTLVGNPIL